jgi:hypothetical protein
MNETARQTITYTIADLENNLRLNREGLAQAQRNAVKYQALINHDMHKIAELQAALDKMNGEIA